MAAVSGPRWEKPRIVYDVDDVLWSLDRRVFGQLGIPLEKHIEYRIQDNPLLTPAEREAVMAAYCDQQTFVDIEFELPAASEIFRPEQLGAHVEIRSNCYSQAIADQKAMEVARLFPDLRPDQLILQTISTKTYRKDLRDDTFIFVDDSPYNIAKSDARFNIIPRQNQNTSEYSQAVMLRAQDFGPRPRDELMRSKNVFRPERPISQGSGMARKIVYNDPFSVLSSQEHADEAYIIYVDNLKEANELIFRLVEQIFTSN